MRVCVCGVSSSCSVFVLVTRTHGADGDDSPVLLSLEQCPAGTAFSTPVSVGCCGLLSVLAIFTTPANCFFSHIMFLQFPNKRILLAAFAVVSSIVMLP